MKKREYKVIYGDLMEKPCDICLRLFADRIGRDYIDYAPSYVKECKGSKKDMEAFATRYTDRSRMCISLEVKEIK